MKRVLMLIFLLAVTAGIGFAIYFLFFRPPGEVTPGENENVNAPVGGLTPSVNGAPTPGVNVNEGLPSVFVPSLIANGGLTQVTPATSVAATSPTLSTGGDVNFFNQGDGKFYRLNADGTTTSLSNKTFFNVDEATFGPSGDQAILEFPDGSNVFFDFSTNRQVTLPQHWEEFDFSPQGNEIVAKSIGLDPASRYLIVSNPDGSQARPIQELGENQSKVQVAWSPNNQIVATSETGRKFGVDRQEVYLIGQNHENFRSIIVEGLDFRPSWAPSGNQLLYSVTNSDADWMPELWVVDAAGDNIGLNRHSLNVKTWADKCTFADDSTLYCAVPDELPRGAGLQPGVADATPDSIYKIDLNTGLQTLVAEPEGGHTVGKMMITPDGRKLYFTDKFGGILNQIQLAP